MPLNIAQSQYFVVLMQQLFEPLSRKSSSVIYSLNCRKCEQLLYVGETGCPLHQRMNDHPSRHFQLPGHSPCDRNRQILENVHKKVWKYQIDKVRKSGTQVDQGIGHCCSMWA